MVQSFLFYFILPLLLFFAKTFYFGIQHEKKKKEKKREVWLDTLCIDEAIRSCIERLEELRQPRGIWASVAIISGGILGLLCSVYLLRQNQGGLFEGMTSLISFSIVLTIIVILYNFVVELIQYRRTRILENANVVVTFYFILFWFAIVGNLFILFLMSGIALDDLSAVVENYPVLLIGATISGFFLFISYRFARSTLHSYEDDLMGYLNEIYSKDYPHIRIKTKENELEGIIQDIFDEDVLILKKRNRLNVVEWESISILDLKVIGDVATRLDDFDNLNPNDVVFLK